MSVKIRLSKTGKTHQLSWRLVAQDSRVKRDGKFLEILGFYNPRGKEKAKIKKDRVNFWVEKGAQMTLAAKKLIETN